MLFQAHRGVSTEAPENTLPAMELAIRQGYTFMELDVSATKDGRFVLMHDTNINRTGRHPDGTPIERKIATKNITYDELCKYDFGIAFSKKYAGTKAPLFEDILECAKKNHLIVKIDSKYNRMSIPMQIKFFKFLEPYKDIIIMTCGTALQMRFTLHFLPDVAFSYEGKITEKLLMKMSKLVARDKLYMWVPYKNSHTTWVKVDFISDELAKRVKKYAKLGIWMISKEEELEEAIRLGADAIETAGELKPTQNSGIIADTHSHTNHSHDAHFPMSEMLAAASAKGLDFLTITDHCDVFACNTQDIYSPIKASYEEVQKLNAEAQNKGTKLLAGVEIGEGFWFPDANLKIQKLVPYDQIIGSVHGVKREGASDCSYALVDFTNWTQSDIHNFLQEYFRDMKTLLATTDFDVLAHITCPLRYISGIYGHKVDLTPYMEDIREMLAYIIAHGIALEVNTSIFGKMNEFMPTREIIKMYKAMGGYLITLGGDAHVPENVAGSFDKALEFLKECGFKNIYYFEKRMPVPCKIQ